MAWHELGHAGRLRTSHHAAEPGTQLRRHRELLLDQCLTFKASRNVQTQAAEKKMPNPNPGDVATPRGWLGDGGEIAFLDVREEGQHGARHPLLAVNLPYSRL